MLDRTKSVAEIVLDHPGTASVMQSYRIDFCCRGGSSLEAACAGKGLDVEEVARAVESAIDQLRDGARDPRDMSTSDLVRFLVARHHAYLRRALPTVEALAVKVARVHGDANPALLDLRDRVLELREALEPHLDAEERVVFPMLTGGADVAAIRKELAAMHAEHLRVGEILTQLRTLADDYTPPEWACTSYRTLMRELAALETDTFRHIHLEAHVLAPRFGGA